MFEAGLHDLLAEDPAIAAILGSGSPPVRADHRSGVFPVQAPEKAALPFIVYTGITGANIQSHDGANALESKRLQIDCYARGYQQAKDLAAAVRDTLLTYRGALSDGSTLDAAVLISNFDSFEDAPFSVRIVLDFDLFFTNQ